MPDFNLLIAIRHVNDNTMVYLTTQKKALPIPSNALYKTFDFTNSNCERPQSDAFFHIPNECSKT